MRGEGCIRGEKQVRVGNRLQLSRLRVKVNQGMIELSKRRFQSMKVVRSSLNLAASVRLGHAGMATLVRHALAAIALCCRHYGARYRAGHNRQRSQ